MLGEDDVVISGIGAHFPECDNLQQYRERLLANDHLISNNDGVPLPKYEGTSLPKADLPAQFSGKMKSNDKFDNTFFGMHARLAAATDAITRHVLESTLEAVLDAGYTPKDMRGTNTAVFMGYHCSESESNFIRESADGFGIMGLNAAMTANRVSYWLDLHGTSFTHNTGLVSGLQGLDMAYRALSKGECDMALVGSASLSYLAELCAHYQDLGWVSPSGVCKPFDESADGGVRSEAVVVMLLQRRSSAHAPGLQRVYASVVHTSSGVCCQLQAGEVPRVERAALAQMLRDFYQECGVHPEDVDYLEADGWGVKEVDAAELGAVDEVLGKARSKPLPIGTVKGNIGQVEAASGLAAVCKVLVAMEAGVIPATINYHQPNANIPGLLEGRLQVVQQNREWQGGLVAVNNLGLAGSAGHVLLRSHAREKVPRAAAKDAMPKLVFLSGRTPEALADRMTLVEANADDPEYLRLVQGAFSTHIFGHMYRGYLVTPCEGQNSKTVFYTGQRRSVWFVYSGMGSQWPTMGADLMRIPIFAAAIERCHRALEPLGVDLKHIVTTSDASIFDNILHSFVGIAAVQVGLTDVLKAVGLTPDGIIGHSVGELGCAYADGCLTAEQMVLAAHARGTASNETDLIPGMMAAVGLGYKDILPKLPPSIEVACHNSATSCTLSGPAVELQTFVAQLKEEGIFARAVNVANIAYHSRYIQPAAPRLLQLLQGVITNPKPRSSRWLSTSVPEANWSKPDATVASAEYFTNNLTSPVLFEEGCALMPSDAITIEIAPHGLMQAILKRSLSADTVNVALTKRDSAGSLMVLHALGQIYLEGLNLNLTTLYPPVELPVSRGTPTVAPLATWDHRDSWPVAFLKAPAEGGARRELTLPLALSTPELVHLEKCLWRGVAVLTPATCVGLVLKIVMNRTQSKSDRIVFRDIVFYESYAIPSEGTREMYIYYQRGSGHWEISVDSQLAAKGVARIIDPEPRKDAAKDNDNDDDIEVVEEVDEDVVEEEAPASTEGITLEEDEVYEELNRRGLVCEGPMRGIERVTVHSSGWSGRVRWDDDVVFLLESMLQTMSLHLSEQRHELHTVMRIQDVTFCAEEMPEKPTLSLIYDPRINSLVAGGLRVSGVQTRAFALPPSFPPVLVHASAFVPHERAHVQDLVHLAAMALDVASNQGRLPLVVADLCESGSALADAVHQAASQQMPDIPVKLERGTSHAETSGLLLSDAPALGVSLAAQVRSRGLVLAELPEQPLPQEVHILYSCSQGQGRSRRTFALLKRVEEVDPSSEVMEVAAGEEVPLDRLQLSRSEVVYIVWRGFVVTEIPAMARYVAAAPNGLRARCVFIVDPSGPEFSLTSPLFAQQLRLGLHVNVLLDRQWGSVYRQHLAQVTEAHAQQVGNPRGRRERPLAMDGVNVQCLGLNPSPTPDHRGPGLLDYAGRTSSGSRVMGVCSVGTPGTGCLQPDPVLSWPVPQSWTAQDAASAPLAHATAHFALLELADVRPGEMVLVAEGWSALGQAAIALLLARGCRPVTTAKDDAQRKQIRANFPELAPEDIMDAQGDSIRRALRMRCHGAECVDVALSQGGPEMMLLCLEMLKKYGRAVHVGADQELLGNKVGLSNFLLSTSLYGLGWGWPLTARAGVKKRVRDLVAAGLQKGELRPLPRQLIGQQAFGDALRCASDGGQKVVLELQDNQRLKGAAHGALVVGGTASHAVSACEWVLRAGPQAVFLGALSGLPGSPGCQGLSWLTRRLQLLSTHHATPVRALESADPREMVASASRLGPLGVAIVLPMDDIAQQLELVRALDLQTRSPNCTLAVLTEGARHPDLVAVVSSRRAQGFPGVLATQAAQVPADARVPTYQQVLRAATAPAVISSAVSVVQLGGHIAGPLEGSAGTLAALLPNSEEALERLGGALQPRELRNVPQHSAGFRELPSLMGRPRGSREVPPVFLVPGVSDSPLAELRPLSYHLLAPTVLLEPPPRAETVQDVAKALLPIVLARWAGPTFTLVGRGWGACVALELARLLERFGRVAVFLVDGAPHALHHALGPLANHHSGLQVGLLRFLLQLDDQALERVSRADSWQQRVQGAVGADRPKLSAALGCVLRRVQALLDYQPHALPPLSDNVTVTLISASEAHLQSAPLAQVCPDLRTSALATTGWRECGNIISSGVQVGHRAMCDPFTVASLAIVF